MGDCALHEQGDCDHGDRGHGNRGALYGDHGDRGHGDRGRGRGSTCPPHGP